MDMKNYECRQGRECPSSLTCRMVKMVTNTITNPEQIATPTRATNATGDLIWSVEPPSDAPSRRAASPLYKLPSSASCDNCFSAAMRRFPAGDELMQSPVNEKDSWANELLSGDECVKLCESNLKKFLCWSIYFYQFLFALHPLCRLSSSSSSSHVRAHFENIVVSEEGGGAFLNRNKWQCSAESGNEIHVKFITRVAVAFWKMGERKSGDRAMKNGSILHGSRRKFVGWASALAGVGWEVWDAELRIDSNPHQQQRQRAQSFVGIEANQRHAHVERFRSQAERQKMSQRSIKFFCAPAQLLNPLKSDNKFSF